MDKKKFHITLLKAKIALDSHKIPFHLHCGTALGAHREKDFIDYDTDIDLGVFYTDYKENLVNIMIENGFTLYKEYGELNNGKEFTFDYNGVHLDIFLIYIDIIKNKLTYWIGSYVKDKMIRWGYRPYVPEIICFKGYIYYTVPKSTLIDMYGDNWQIPKNFGYFEGIEGGHYKGRIDT